jgi:peroxiredoxin
MTSRTASRRLVDHDHQLDASTSTHVAAARRRRRVTLAAWGTALLVAIGLVTAGLLTSQPDVSTDTRTAPDFTLPTSDGESVTLSSLRGTAVILYFNEGAGCDSCLTQMAEIEKEAGFEEAGITVLPIVMNTAEQINVERERLGVTTPFLLDDGTVSEAYGTLGSGMHEGLPGHGFVLIDADGIQKWYGNYPSMWLAPKDLLQEATSRL